MTANHAESQRTEVHEMRRVLVLAAMAALIIGAIPSVASAARATRMESDALAMSCLITSEDQGTLYAEAISVSGRGGFAGLYWWAPGLEPFEEPPTLLSGENSVVGEPSGSSLDATMTLYEFVMPDPEDPEPNPYGAPAGEAILSATFVNDGDPVSYSDQSSGTNAKYRVDVLYQPLATNGLIQLPDATFGDLSDCQAVREHVSLFETHPDTRIERSDGFGLFCEWNDGERQVLLFASTEQSGSAFSEIFVTDASGTHAGFAEAASLDTRAFAATWELFDIGGEGEIAPAAVGGGLSGSASATATLSRTGEGDHVVDKSHGQMVKFFYDVYAVSGELELTTPAGTVTLSMDEACSANSARTQYRISSPTGGGKPVRNDAPANAEPIGIGESVSVRTAGTDAAAEASCVIEVPEAGEVFDVPIEHTAWWTFAGTGGDVTVDTTGSTFDTVVGVYVLDGEQLVQVGCVDDVQGEEGGSLQAVITIATDADVTYYVQAGGFGGSSGQLELAVR